MTIGFSTRAVSAPVGVALRKRFGKEPVKYVPLSQFFTSRQSKDEDDDALYGRRARPRTRKKAKEKEDEPRKDSKAGEEEDERPKKAAEALESRSERSFKPPRDVRAAAAQGLALRRKHGRGGLSSQEAGKQGIGSGVQRAVNLKNGDSLSLETIKRMHAFFSRHQKNRGKPGDTSAGRIAWLLWGGTPGWRWAKSILSKEEGLGQPVARNGLPQDEMTLSTNVATTPVPVGAGDGRKFLDYGRGHPYHGRDFDDSGRRKKKKRKSLSKRLSYLLTIP